SESEASWRSRAAHADSASSATTTEANFMFGVLYRWLDVESGYSRPAGRTMRGRLSTMTRRINRRCWHDAVEEMVGRAAISSAIQRAGHERERETQRREDRADPVRGGPAEAGLDGASP